jgi:N-acyl-D-amino-acid deacylase
VQGWSRAARLLTPVFTSFFTPVFTSFSTRFFTPFVTSFAPRPNSRNAAAMRTMLMKSAKAAAIPIVCLALLVSCADEPTRPPARPEFPITGAAVLGMESYDQIIPDLLRTYAIPGAAVAVVRDGKLIYARGFGYADVENSTPVQPDALFRIASVSKPITSAAIMTLVEEGKLTLDDRVAPFIAHLTHAPGATVDPRWEQITIRQLLNHTGGWDRGKPNGGFDPMDRPLTAAAAVNAPAPASAETIIRYMKGMPLDFDPGEKHVYSNFGYAILGRVIEQLSGVPYEEYVRARVLQPVGATRTRSGKSRMSDAFEDEVKYYYPGMGVNGPLAPSVFPGEGAVPLNYGGYHLEAMDASGAWVSSTIDLLRFVGGVDGRANRPDILSGGLVTEMTTNGATVCASGACYYAGGWVVRPTQGDATWSHGGTLPGTTAMLVRTYHNFSLVALINTRSLTANLEAELYKALWNGLAGVTSFPTHDLFSTFR